MERAHSTAGDGVAVAHAARTEHAHPSPWTYVGVFAALFTFTFLEVWVTQPFLGVHWPARQVTQVPSLLVLMVLKFATVAGFYMHLKFDHRIFAGFFSVGLFLAISMLLTLMALFLAHYREPFDASARQQQTQQTGAATPAAGAAERR